MRSFATYAILSSAVGLAAAGAVERRWDYPQSFKLARRQADPEPGTPRYACHENCGLSITLGREEEDHCNHDEWNQRYNSCLECANTFDIWIYYGRSITVYAGECGLTPVPSPSGFEAPSEPTTTAPPPAAVTTTTPPPAAVTTTDTPAEVETTTGGASEPETTEEPTEEPTESPAQSGGYPVPEESTTLAPSVVPSSTPSSGNGTAPPEPTLEEAGAGNVAASLAMAGAAAVLALAL